LASERAAAPLEVPVWIRINGVRRRVLSCSPHDVDALVLGHLLCEGWITAPSDVRVLSVVRGPGDAIGADVVMQEALARAGEVLERHRIEHGCGLRHALDCAPGSLHRAAADAAAPTRAVADLRAAFRALFAAADAAAPDGGVHAAGLVEGDALRYTATDVARHCAVDRVIGTALRAGAAPSGLTLILTARVSGRIALKAAHAGVAAVASRSLATSLAREIAAAARLPVAERAVRREAR
jgi:FdhD protein